MRSRFEKATATRRSAKAGTSRSRNAGCQPPAARRPVEVARSRAVELRAAEVDVVDEGAAREAERVAGLAQTPLEVQVLEAARREALVERPDPLQRLAPRQPPEAREEPVH